MGRANRKGFTGADVRASSLGDILGELERPSREEKIDQALGGVMSWVLRTSADGTEVLDLGAFEEEVNGFLECTGESWPGLAVAEYDINPEHAEAVMEIFYNMTPSQVRELYEEASAEHEDIDDRAEAIQDGLYYAAGPDDLVTKYLRPTQPAFREYKADDGFRVFVNASNYLDPETSELYRVRLQGGDELWQGNIYYGVLRCKTEEDQIGTNYDVRCEEHRTSDGRSFRAQAAEHDVLVAEAFGDKNEPQRTVARIRRDGQAEEIRELSSEEVAAAGGAEGWALLELGRGLYAKSSEPAPAPGEPTDINSQIERLLS